MRPSSARDAAAPAPARSGDEEAAALVAGARAGDAAAQAALVRRYQPLVERVVAGALGVDGDLADAVQDVLVAMLEGIGKLRDPAALRSWIVSLAVFTARSRIRRRRRWRWMRFVAPEELPDIPAPAGPRGESEEALRATYLVLDTLPGDERLVFGLRFLAEMQLAEIADASRVSLATVKRRLGRAEARFVEAARAHPALRDRLEQGRWGRGGEDDCEDGDER